MDLVPSEKAFVDAVMEPLGDDPPRRELLETVVATAGVYRRPDAGREESAIARMRETAPRFLSLHRLAWGCLMVLALAAIGWSTASPAALRSIDAIWAANSAGRMISMTTWTSPRVPPLPRPHVQSDRFEDDPFCKRLLRRLPEDKKRLWLGDLEHQDQAGRWAAVRDAHPGDPAHFYAWALAFRSELGRWPEEFVQRVEDLDPDNGMFHLFNAAARLDASIGKPPVPLLSREQRRALRASGKPLPGSARSAKVITNRKAFDAALVDLEHALAKPRFDDYLERLNRIRRAASTPPREFAEVYVGQLLTYSQPEDYSSGWVLCRSLGEAFSLAAEDAANSGDKEQLAKIEHLLVRTSRHLLESSSGLIPSLIARKVTMQGAEGTAKAWKALGEPSRALPLENLATLLDRKKHPAPSAVPDALDENRGSSIASASLQLPHQSPGATLVTEQDLRGGRLAEYSMYERFLLHGIAIAFALVLLFLIVAPHPGRANFGKLPARLGRILDARDFAWIALLGVAAPMALYAVSTRCVWLASREFGMSPVRSIAWVAQALSLVVSMVLAALQTLRWRFRKKDVFLGFGWSGFDPGWFFLFIGLAAILSAAGLQRLLASLHLDLEAELFVILSFPCLALIWLLVLAVGFFKGPEARALHRRMILTALRPFVIMALVVTTLAIPFVKREELRHVAEIRYESLEGDDTVFVHRKEREYARWLAEDALRHLKALE
ncbi:hypothetical protein [Luteolibacter marinus]|uniref:hypothetical protein n=1 Tax=Luteolibacter marinus TaxID=2776705 RepID=UPI001868E190|nr:hypothetical protein [Luteolibacter marinus]